MTLTNDANHPLDVGAHPLDRWRDHARQLSDPGAWAYLMSAAGDGRAALHNELDFLDLTVRPRVCTDVRTVDTSVDLLGQTLSHPFIVAPMAMHALFHPGGETETALGASRTDTVFTASMESSISWDEVAAQRLWCHISPQADDTVTHHLLNAAKTAGASAVVLTLDTPVSGARYQQREAMSTVPPHIDRPMLPSSDTAPGAFTWSGYTWDDVAATVAATDLPVIGKGILAPRDAEQAVQAGLDGIVVSNHGGRNLDLSPSTATSLAGIAKTIDQRIPVLVDGGIRRGASALAAIALGADAVMIGRPVMWGLAANGANGVHQVLSTLITELELTMQLCGITELRQAHPDLVAHRPGTARQTI